MLTCGSVSFLKFRWCQLGLSELECRRDWIQVHAMFLILALHLKDEGFPVHNLLLVSGRDKRDMYYGSWDLEQEETHCRFHPHFIWPRSTSVMEVPTMGVNSEKGAWGKNQPWWSRPGQPFPSFSLSKTCGWILMSTALKELYLFKSIKLSHKSIENCIIRNKSLVYTMITI